MNARRGEGGFILLPVVLTLALLATLAFLLNRESGMGVELAVNQGVGDEARYVAEAGLAQAGWLVNQSGCTGYTDLDGVSFGGGTYDVSVTPAGGSPVSLTAAAALPDGTRRTLTRQGVPVYQPPVTLVEQPDGAKGEDTWVYEWKPTWNYGADTQLGVDTYFANSEARSLLRFDSTAIPPGATVLDATLELYMNNPSDTGGPVGVHRVTADWVEGAKGGGWGPGANWTSRDGTTPWATPGGDFDPQVVAVTTVPGGAVGWYTWKVTSLVDGWHAGSFPNQGLMLRLQQAGRAAYFHSSDHTNATVRPKLTVTYACECGGSCSSGPPPAAVLLVVPDKTALEAQDVAKKAFMESWGHPVSLISAAAPQAEFDAAVLDADVAHVSEEITSTDLGTKLRDAAIGVVNEEQALSAAFGFSSTYYAPTPAASLNITDNGHYITTPFSSGWLTIFSTNQAVVSLAGTLAGGLEALGYYESVGGPPGLAVIDTGSALYGGGTAAARRVQLPWGGNDFDINALTTDGQTLLRRAIEWAAGAGATVLGPVAHWKLDEISGPTAVDSEGGHDGTWTNGPSWAPGAVGGGLSFDGSNDYVAVPHAESLAVAGVMSFAAWAKTLDTSGGYKAILAKDTPGNGLSNYWFGIYNDELVFGFFAGGGFRVVQTPSSNLQPDTWYHLAASFDDAADEVRLYVDGAEVHVGAFAYTPTTETADLWIGNSVDGEYWNGTLDDVRIYNSVIGAAEVAALASAGSPPPGGPITLIPVADAVIYEGSADTNYGTQDQMRVGEDSGGNRYRSLLRFDVSGVPANATVTSATLRTYVVASSGNKTVPVGIYRVTNTWEETAATWSNTGDGGTYDPTQLALGDIPRNFTGWVEWSLPAGLIHEWVDAVSPNHGLLLNYEASFNGNFRNPASRENAAADQRPQLVIEYLTVIILPPPEPEPM